MNRKLIITGIVLLIIAIILGAFGAHGLKKIVSEDAIKTFEVGVRYQFYAAFGLLILGMNTDKFNVNWNIFYNLLFIGVLFFSGSIYLLVINDYVPISKKIIGPITPVGGLLQISSWVYLLFSFLKKQ